MSETSKTRLPFRTVSPPSERRVEAVLAVDRAPLQALELRLQAGPLGLGQGRHGDDLEGRRCRGPRARPRAGSPGPAAGSRAGRAAGGAQEAGRLGLGLDHGQHPLDQPGLGRGVEEGPQQGQAHVLAAFHQVGEGADLGPYGVVFLGRGQGPGQALHVPLNESRILHGDFSLAMDLSIRAAWSSAVRRSLSRAAASEAASSAV